MQYSHALGLGFPGQLGKGNSQGLTTSWVLSFAWLHLKEKWIVTQASRYASSGIKSCGTEAGSSSCCAILVTSLHLWMCLSTVSV